MHLIGPNRQLGLFVRTTGARVRMPEQTALKIRSLLAELLAHVWRFHAKSRRTVRPEDRDE
jgi:hypothetical protein